MYIIIIVVAEKWIWIEGLSKFTLEGHDMFFWRRLRNDLVMIVVYECMNELIVEAISPSHGGGIGRIISHYKRIGYNISL